MGWLWDLVVYGFAIHIGWMFASIAIWVAFMVIGGAIGVVGLVCAGIFHVLRIAWNGPKQLSASNKLLPREQEQWDKLIAGRDR